MPPQETAIALSRVYPPPPLTSTAYGRIFLIASFTLSTLSPPAKIIGFDKFLGSAYAKAEIGAGTNLPSKGNVFISVNDSDKMDIIPIARDLVEIGFNLVPGEHPIIPVMLGDAKLTQQMAARLLDEEIYVVGFSFPVVPHGKARIRTQMSAAHSESDINRAITAFAKVGSELRLI